VLQAPEKEHKQHGFQKNIIFLKYQQEIFCEKIFKKSTIGKQIHDLLKNGKLVSNDIVCSLIGSKIKQKNYINNFLLDGFPRTKKQAEYISHLKIKIDFILEFMVPDELILKRICGRRVHVPSGRIYNIYFNPPREDGKDDITKEKLTIREDDKIEIIQKRLKTYKENSNSITEYYKKEQKLKKLKYFKIDGKENIWNIRKK